MSKPPRLVFSPAPSWVSPEMGDRPLTAGSSTVYAFPPNRDTMGGTAYLLVDAGDRPDPDPAERVNILIDCPAWNDTTQAWLQAQGGVQWLVITHRDSIGKAQTLQTALGCAIAIQEQEAYLLPGAELTPFQHNLSLTPQTRLIWTPGHTPGSSCVYHAAGGGILFTGRHLLPTPTGSLSPIKTAKTFHWHRQLASVQRLRDAFTPDTLHWICPGANLGFLRGQVAIASGYAALQAALPTEALASN